MADDDYEPDRPPVREIYVAHEVRPSTADHVGISASSHVLQGPLGLWYVIDMLEVGPGGAVTLCVRYQSAVYERAVEVAREKPSIYRRLRLRERIGLRIAGRKP